MGGKTNVGCLRLPLLFFIWVLLIYVHVSVNYFIKFCIKIKNKKLLILLIILSIFYKKFFKIGNIFFFFLLIYFSLVSKMRLLTI